MGLGTTGQSWETESIVAERPIVQILDYLVQSVERPTTTALKTETPTPSYCISLTHILDEINRDMGKESIAAEFGMDMKLMATAALNHLFYQTLRRGNRWFVVMSEMENLGIPSDKCYTIYGKLVSWIKHELTQYIKDGINITNYRYYFITDTDIVVVPVNYT